MQREKSSSSSAQGGPPRKPCVLVVEDYADAREILSEALAAHGLGVETAADGHEALEKADQCPPDAVLLDLSLPRLDGFEVARRLRSDPRFARVPLVAYTAFGSPEQRRRAVAAGCWAVLTKPTPTQVLVAILRQLLDQAAADPVLAEADPDETPTRLYRRRERYRAQVRRESEELARVWREARSEVDLAQPVASLCAELYRFMASCTSLGLEASSRAAWELERALEEYLRSPMELERRRVDRQLDWLLAQISRETRGQPPASRGPERLDGD
jgi:CheY-like chemotaxis protein